MPDKKIAVENIPFMMLDNGKITSNMDYWVNGISSNSYREVSKCPPIQISTLTRNLVDSITVSPDPEDADAFEALVQELKSSLEITQNTIAKLRKV